MDSWRVVMIPDQKSANKILKPDNVALFVGSFIVGFIILLATIGPYLAPQDPLKENFLVFLDENTFAKPPFPAFAVPGFPLGSDEFGRDLFSRLLWAIRPTLTLILVVASLRLIFGTIFGMIAGWSDRWPARWINTAISAGLAVPVLFIALFVIAAFGQQSTIWAFAVGLTITGWSESARLIREQTRHARSQVYIEASIALGAGSPQIIFSHILPQVVSIIWMVLAFEVSAVLTVTAELGVLGYFIHAIWIPIGDWVGIRASGAPELGQMLTNLQSQPWGAITAGFIIFLTVLGFNLLGEGLRNAPKDKNRVTQGEGRNRSYANWIEEQVYNPLTSFRRQLPTYTILAFLFVMVLGGGLWLNQSQSQVNQSQVINLPGGNLWITEGRDPQGTRFTSQNGPSSARVAWSLQAEGGYSGGPVISSDGTLYLASLDQKITAFTPDGKQVWRSLLPGEPVGSPALASSGNLFVADRRGGLTRISPSGQVSVLVPGSGKTPALSGPVIAADETAYYVTTEEIMAVSGDGLLTWRTELPTYSLTNPIPHLTADDSYLIFEDFLIDTVNGKLFAKASPDPLDKIIVGVDRNTYRVSQTMLSGLTLDNTNSPANKTVKWDIRTLGISFRFPRDAGVAPDGKIWILYGSEYDYARLVWLNSSGEFLAAFDYPYRGFSAPMIGIDARYVVYICGNLDQRSSPNQESTAECRANRIGSNSPVWRLSLDDPGTPVGGAIADNRLYVSTSSGKLYLIVKE